MTTRRGFIGRLLAAAGAMLAPTVSLAKAGYPAPKVIKAGFTLTVNDLLDERYADVLSQEIQEEVNQAVDDWWKYSEMTEDDVRKLRALGFDPEAILGP